MTYELFRHLTISGLFCAMPLNLDRSHGSPVGSDASEQPSRTVTGRGASQRLVRTKAQATIGGFQLSIVWQVTHSV
jgi:hypothetical protein